MSLGELGLLRFDLAHNKSMISVSKIWDKMTQDLPKQFNPNFTQYLLGFSKSSNFRHKFGQNVSEVWDKSSYLDFRHLIIIFYYLIILLIDNRTYTPKSQVFGIAFSIVKKNTFVVICLDRVCYQTIHKNSESVSDVETAVKGP